MTRKDFIYKDNNGNYIINMENITNAYNKQYLLKYFRHNTTMSLSNGSYIASPITYMEYIPKNEMNEIVSILDDAIDDSDIPYPAVVIPNSHPTILIKAQSDQYKEIKNGIESSNIIKLDNVNYSADTPDDVPVLFISRNGIFLLVEIYTISQYGIYFKFICDWSSQKKVEQALFNMPFEKLEYPYDDRCMYVRIKGNESTQECVKEFMDSVYNIIRKG